MNSERQPALEISLGSQVWKHSEASHIPWSSFHLWVLYQAVADILPPHLLAFCCCRCAECLVQVSLYFVCSQGQSGWDLKSDGRITSSRGLASSYNWTVVTYFLNPQAKKIVHIMVWNSWICNSKKTNNNLASVTEEHRAHLQWCWGGFFPPVFLTWKTH